MVGRVSGVEGGRAKELVALLLNGWLLRCVVEWKVSSRLNTIIHFIETRLQNTIGTVIW